MRSNVPILSVLRPWTKRNFEKKLVPDGECLIFTGSKNKHGYGFVDVTGPKGVGRYPMLAHRLAWVLENGCEVPDGAIICHRCNRPSCCNPDHLYAGTYQTNADDRVRAGTQARGARSNLFMLRGVAHPRALYSQEVRDHVIRLRREAKSYREIRKLTGVTAQTASRWWNEALAAGLKSA